MSESIYANPSNAKLLAKREFARKVGLARENGEDWVKSEEEIFAEYLRDVHEINVPENFAQEIGSAHCTFHAYSRSINLPYNTIDAIVEACSKWSDYLEPTDEVFSNLVCNEVLSMVRIHTSVISGRNIVQEPGIRLKQEPPYLMVTIVTLSGALRVIS